MLFACVFSLMSLVSFLPSARAAEGTNSPYADAAGEIDPGLSSAGGTLDILGMEVSNTVSDVYMTLSLNGDISTTDWGKFLIGIASGKSAGTTTGNGWGRPINLEAPTGGMDFWIGSWVDGGGGCHLWNYTNAAWNGPSACTFSFVAGVQSTLSYSVPLASLGLAAGDTFYFDAYASGGGGGDSAIDALSNPNVSVTSWGQTYTSKTTGTGGVGLNAYTVTGSAANHAPEGASNAVTLLENSTYTFAVADFGFTDPSDTPPNHLAAVKITTLPGAGTLSTGGSAATNGQTVALTVAGETWAVRDTGRYWNTVASSADGTKLVAGDWNGRLYTSTDSGANWTARENNRLWSSVASSADGTKLVAAVRNGQIYTSTDSGTNWTARESNRMWSGVASSADGTKLVAVVSLGQIYTSTDSGTNWTARESNRDWTPVTSSADGTKLVAVVWNGQIYTSSDSGTNWTPHASNREWRSIASSSDGTKLVAVANTNQIYTSTDSGMNWTARESNRAWRGVASSSDGSKLVAVANTNQIYISTDSGTNWTARESNREWTSVASSSDGSKLVAVANT
ncbi:MAG TPA: hypothetical protein DCS43_06070, partial [Verrucomicrobia bacterium]|nr:hypothetical protein [Verrucomicrobiota bacterium]